MTPKQQVVDYLSRFESHLRYVSSSEKEEILREIEAHIRDASERDNGNTAAVLDRLGDPRVLARQYRDSVLLRSASRSFSPTVLLRAALRLATKGISGIFISFCAVFGYAFGIGFLLVGIIKPLAPAHTGLWLQNGVVVSSGALVVIPPPPAHEVLGWWLIPVALVLGTLVSLVTTFMIRLSLRLSRSWGTRLGGRPIMSSI